MGVMGSIFGVPPERVPGHAGRVLDGGGGSLYGSGVRALAVALATIGPVGYAPVAAGTAGSLAALPLLPVLAALRSRSAAAHAVVLMALVALAVWAAGRAEDALGGHDPQRIVIDELAGMLVAGTLAPAGWAPLTLAFGLFRLFDIVKPFPASRLDALPGGLGVVGDDLVAGCYAGLAVQLVLAFA